MVIEEIKLKNFRNFAEANINSLSLGLNIFQGANGSGKTNLLEAISLSSLGKSCRGALDWEMVKFGAKAAIVEISGIVQKKKLISNFL
jgi:DNA replication and repair protein RecF